MRRTFHFSSGRGLETDSCCCSVKHGAIFHSILFSLLAVLALVTAIFYTSEIGMVPSMSLCTILVISLLCSALAPIGVYRRSCGFLTPFIVELIVYLALCLGLMLTTAIYAVMQWENVWAEILSVLDCALQFLKPVLEYVGLTPLTDVSRILLLVSLSLLFLIGFMLLLNALVVVTILWRRYFRQGDACESDGTSMEWMFARLNGSCTATLRKIAPRYEETKWRRSTYISVDDGLDSTF